MKEKAKQIMYAARSRHCLALAKFSNIAQCSALQVLLGGSSLVRLRLGFKGPENGLEPRN